MERDLPNVKKTVVERFGEQGQHILQAVRAAATELHARFIATQTDAFTQPPTIHYLEYIALKAILEGSNVRDAIKSFVFSRVRKASENVRMPVQCDFSMFREDLLPQR